MDKATRTAGDSGTMSTEIITALYKGLLGRMPDPAGIGYWLGRLDSGADFSELLKAIMATEEYRGIRESSLGEGKIRERAAGWAKENLFQPIVIVDVGAQELEDEKHIYSEVVNCALPHRIIGFEPLQHRIDEAVLRKGNSNLTLMPFFIGDGGRYKFNINRPDSTSSLLPFNTPLTSELRELSHLFTERTEETGTVRLDDVLASEQSVDFLKMDIQGFEFKALQSSPETLAKTNVIHCEVSFMEIYEGQALFSELEILMRNAGFTFIDFTHLCRYACHGEHESHRDRLGWGDALFIKDACHTDARGLLVQALLAIFVYGKCSLAESLAKKYDLLTGGSFSSIFRQQQVLQ